MKDKRSPTQLEALWKEQRFLAEQINLRGRLRLQKGKGLYMDEIKVEKEKKRLEALLKRADIPAQQQDVLAPVIDNMSWQRIKLDEAREEMKEASIVCHFNNGGGQEGERENPIFKAYINLWRAYMVGLEKYTSYLPKEMQEEVTGSNITILEQVKRMKEGNK